MYCWVLSNKMDNQTSDVIVIRKESIWQSYWTFNGWSLFFNSYDVIRDNSMGVELLNAIEETYSSAWQGTKENQECINGAYFIMLLEYPRGNIWRSLFGARIQPILFISNYIFYTSQNINFCVFDFITILLNEMNWTQFTKITSIMCQYSKF